jgi:uncharacterized YccA/Bax inhibitor family protein
MATGNPTMNLAVYQRAALTDTPTRVMTVQGTVVKTAVLLVILLAAAVYTWSQAAAGAPLAYGLLVAGSLGGLVTAVVTTFRPQWSPVTAPLYAGLQGLVMGAVSAVFEAMYPGVVIRAVGLSIGVLAVMLFVYGTRIIRATERFKIGLVAATGAVFLVYLVDMVLSLFGAHVPFIHQSGWVGIGFSLIVVIIAALNLILDFDFIEQGAKLEAPRYMEWYGGFSLLVTLVWMYLEILRLLAKVSGGSRG